MRTVGQAGTQAIRRCRQIFDSSRTEYDIEMSPRGEVENRRYWPHWSSSSDASDLDGPLTRRAAWRAGSFPCGSSLQDSDRAPLWFGTAIYAHTFRRILDAPNQQFAPAALRFSRKSWWTNNCRPAHSFVKPSALHCSEPTPLWTKNSPSGSYFLLISARRG